jgi:hypothetical protein
MKKLQVAANILGSSEVQEMLFINRSRLSALVIEGKITPLKQFAKEKVFWLPDVERLAAELMKDTRTNLYKNGGLKNAL